MTDVRSPQRDFVQFAESFLDQHGPDTSSGVGWLRGDADTRYRTLLGVVRPEPRPVSLLDFGCGLAGLYEFMLRTGAAGIEYAGLDLSPKFLALARQKYPAVDFYEVDVLAPAAPALPRFDYIVLNGVFTYKGALSQAEMFEYLQTLVTKVFAMASVGVAFNVITTEVEWTRDDLFHLPVDALLNFLSRHVSRHVVIRHDYGLFEYTAYVYKDPSDPERADVKRVLTAGLRS